MQAAMQSSDILRKNALYGCSLLFIHDGKKVDVRMIDFEKATPIENEDIGTMEGVANIIKLFKSLA